jgi:hypothetical protein
MVSAHPDPDERTGLGTYDGFPQSYGMAAAIRLPNKAVNYSQRDDDDQNECCGHEKLPSTNFAQLLEQKKGQSKNGRTAANGPFGA